MARKLKIKPDDEQQLMQKALYARKEERSLSTITRKLNRINHQELTPGLVKITTSCILKAGYKKCKPRFAAFEYRYHNKVKNIKVRAFVTIFSTYAHRVTLVWYTKGGPSGQRVILLNFGSKSIEKNLSKLKKMLSNFKVGNHKHLN